MPPLRRHVTVAECVWDSDDDELDNSMTTGSSGPLFKTISDSTSTSSSGRVSQVVAGNGGGAVSAAASLPGNVFQRTSQMRRRSLDRLRARAKTFIEGLDSESFALGFLKDKHKK